MPTSEEILAGLQAITNKHEIFAIGWHAVFYVVLFLLAVKKWKPSNRLLLSLISSITKSGFNPPIRLHSSSPVIPRTLTPSKDESIDRIRPRIREESSTTSTLIFFPVHSW